MKLTLYNKNFYILYNYTTVITISILNFWLFQAVKCLLDAQDSKYTLQQLPWKAVGYVSFGKPLFSHTLHFPSKLMFLLFSLHLLNMSPIRLLSSWLKNYHKREYCYIYDQFGDNKGH